MNAKEEFIQHTQGMKVKCASLKTEQFDNISSEFIYQNIILKVNYSEVDYKEFLKSLDYEYDNGYGGQELYGSIWYEDGTWSSRGEYDGSEWWQYNKCPEIDQNCL